MTFATSTAKRISPRQPATWILLIYFGDLYSSLENLQDYQLLATRQMPAQLFYTSFPSHYDGQHKSFLSTQALLIFSNWKAYGIFVHLPIYSLEYNEEVI